MDTDEERVYFEDDGVRVTNKNLTIGEETVPIESLRGDVHHITRVYTSNPPATTVLRLVGVLLFLAGLLLLAILGQQRVLAYMAVAMTIIGIVQYVWSNALAKYGFELDAPDRKLLRTDPDPSAERARRIRDAVWSAVTDCREEQREANALTPEDRSALPRPAEGAKTTMAFSGDRVGREVVRRYEEGERDFHQTDLRGMQLRSADVRGVNLAYADLAKADLSRSNLSGANLSGADLSEADVSGTDLGRADLSGADLSGADLGGADLSGADLGGASLRNAKLGRTGLLVPGFRFPADLSGAGLVRADLRGADLRGADLRQADLTEADLGDADLQGASVTNQQLAQAANLGGATMPDGTLRLKRRKMSSGDTGPTGASEVVPANLRQAVLDRDDYICRYCGRRSQTMEVDHVIPVSQGGTSMLHNLVTACRDCNRKKAGRTPEEAGMEMLPVRTRKRNCE
ncbi:MAG: pentapeptide repeat-containing protein [bacterium]